MPRLSERRPVTGKTKRWYRQWAPSRYAAQPKHLPYPQQPMTQISARLIRALPVLTTTPRGW